jgi:hypothetical protein
VGSNGPCGLGPVNEIPSTLGVRARAPLAAVAPGGRFSVAEAGNATRAGVPPTRAAPSRLLVG